MTRKLAILGLLAFALPQADAQTATTTTLAQSSNTSTLGQPVTLTATVKQTVSGAVINTGFGAVTFFGGPQGQTIIGSAGVIDGTATLSNALLPLGAAQKLKAIYVPGSGFAQSTSAVIQHSVTAVAGSGFGLATVPTAVGAVTGSMAQADFNNDGIMDVAYIDSSGNVKVLLGHEDGIFDAPASEPAVVAGTTPAFLVAADFNVDGNVDLAYSADNVVVIYLGNGDGTFGSSGSPAFQLHPNTFNLSYIDGAPASQYPFCGDFGLSCSNYESSHAPLVSLAVADVNGDGIPDLISTTSLAIVNVDLDQYFWNVLEVVVLLGDATGNFPTQQNSILNEASPGLAAVNPGGFSLINPAGLAVGGFTQGQLGVIVSATAAPTSGGAAVTGLYLFTGIGNGTFAVPSGPMPNGSPVAAGSFVAGDFNGVGYPGVAFNDTTGNVRVLLNSASTPGTFTLSATPSYVSADGFGAMATGDFNGDGKLDLVAAVPSTNSVVSLPGNGDGTFGAPSTTAQVCGSANGAMPGAILTADYGSATGVNEFQEGFLAACQGNQAYALGFGRSSTTTALTASTNSAIIGQSVTLTAHVTPATATGNVTFYNGTTILGTGTLSSGVAALPLSPALTNLLLPTSTVASGLPLLARYEGDSSNGISTGSLALLVTAMASKGFGAAPSTTVNNPQVIAQADFNQDGIVDFAVGTGNNISILLGNAGGNGAYTAQAAILDVGGVQSIAAGDVNGDGKPDLIAMDQGGNITVFLGNGAGGFTKGSTYNSPVNVVGTATVQIADFNLDGIPDVLYVGGGNPSYAVALLGNGDGTFQSALRSPVGSGSNGQNAAAAAIGDFNGDGIPDLLVLAAANGTPDLFLLTGQGDGTFSLVSDIGALGPPRPNSPLAVGDFLGNGKLDVAYLDGSFNIRLALGNGANPPTFTFAGPTTSGAAGAAISGLATGDFNGDGILDLAAAVPNSNTVALLLGAPGGTGAFAAPQLARVCDGPQGIVAGNYDGSGRNDFAVACHNSASVQAFLGEGFAISSLNPASTVAGAGATQAFTLTINATNSNFSAGDIVNWVVGATSTPLPATVAANGSSLTVTISGSPNDTLLKTAGTTATVSVTDPGSGLTSNSLTFSVGSAPAIQAIIPSSAAVGGSSAPITVTGTFLAGGDTLNFQPPGGALITGIATAFVNGTLTATLPQSALTAMGTGSVIVVDGGSGVPSASGFSFSIVAAPALTTLNPTTAGAGSQSFSLTINGTGFVTGDTVKWQLAGAAAQPLTPVVVNGSGMQITVPVPTILLAAIGTASVTVTDPDGAASTPVGGLPFSIAAPSISVLNPASVGTLSAAAAGAGSFILSVNGSNFIPGTTVSGGYTGSVVLFTDSVGTQHTLIPTSSSASQLQVTVPNSYVGSAIANLAVAVQNPGLGANFSGGAVSNTVQLPVAAPVITSVNPPAETTVPAGSSSPVLTVNGSNFVATSVLAWCNLCSGSPTILTPSSTPTTNQFSVSIPTTNPNLLAATGTVQIWVANDPANLTGLSTNSNPATNLQIASLAIQSLSPTSTLSGGPAFSLTITGVNQNFNGGAQVLFGNGLAPISPASSGGSITGGSITVVVPASYIATPGAFSIQVQNPGGAISAPVSFPIQQLSISNIVPTPLVAGSAALNLDIQGTSFSPSTSIIWTSGITATTLTPTYNSSTDLSAVATQALLAQAATVEVTASVAVQGVNIVSAPFAVSIVGPIIGVPVPSSSVVNGGAFPLQISGSNFLNGSTVHWTDGTGTTTSLITSYVSATQLTALVTASLLTSAGTALITVVNPAPSGSTGAVSNAEIFAVGPTPTINTSNGLSVCPGGINCTPAASVTAATASFLLKVTGTNYQSGSIVVWNVNGAANNLVTEFTDADDLEATVPANLLTTVGSALITVLNPGNAVSNGIIFNVNAGATPAITNVLPANGVTVGSAAFELTVSCTNFGSGAQVNWTSGGTTTGLSTVVQDAQTLVAVVPATLITSVGTAFLTVVSAGATSNAVAFSVNPIPAVTLTSLAQTNVAAGSGTFTLGLIGTNFTSGSVVQWNAGSGAQALGTIFTGPTTLSALVPATLLATAETAFVSVANTGGVLSNSLPFTIGAASGPSINANGLSPSSAVAGAGAFELVVSGQNFVSGSQVNWNAGGSPQVLPTVFVSASELTVVVPATLLTVAGTVFVSVVNTGGLSSGLASFVIGSATGPTIVTPGGLSPASAVAAGAAFQLSVTGSNFVSGATVEWEAGGTPTALTTAFISGSQLTALVPAALIATTGNVFVGVSNPSGPASNLVSFTIAAVPGPTIASTNGLNPSAAVTASAAITMTVTGTNFVNGSVVQWNTGGTPTPLTTGFISATQLTALVPATLLAAPATAFVVVVNPDMATSNTVTFTVAGPAPLGTPTLTSIAPASAAAGSASVQLTVVGTNFAAATSTTAGSVVQWDGTSLVTSFVSATQLTAQAPSSLLQTPGTNFVAVLNGNVSSTGATFQVSGPTATSVAPATIAAGAAPFNLLVTGTNFVSGSAVVWSGTSLATTFNTANQVTAQVPANLVATAGSAFVLVSNPGGSTSSPLIFTISVPPAGTVSALSPATAVAGSAAFQLSVTGSGFVSGSTVVWNGSPLPTGFVSATIVTALVGANLIALPGAANVAVQNPGAPISTTVAFPINGPTIATLAPATASAGDPAFTLTVTGTNFVPGTAIQWNGTMLPTAYSSATQVQAAVSASLVASAATISVTAQNPGGATSPSQSFIVGQPALSIITSTLPSGIVGTLYSQTLVAQGGNQPYNWTITAGTLPGGVTLNGSSGTMSGTPTGAASVTLSVTVTDSVGRTAVKALPLQVYVALTISTAASLPAATAGTAYSEVLAAAGGAPPYLWSVAGNLPPGLTLNVATGQISGLPLAPGAYNFTINVTDSQAQQNASQAFTATVTVASLTIGGLAASVGPAQQIPITVNIGSAYSVALSGALTLTFTSQVGGTDPSIQFSTGGSTVAYTIPAGSTTAVFPQNTQLLLTTGTVAGTIVIKASLQAGATDITPSTAPSATTAIPEQAPVITSATLQPSTGGVTVTIAGYATSKSVTQASLQFNPASGSALTASTITVPLTAVITAWYQSAASASFGSQFTVNIPVNVAGNVAAIGSVTVTLTNAQGSSATATANLQ